MRHEFSSVLSETPTVQSVGIISAQNAHVKPGIDMNRLLLSDLRGLKCGPIEHCAALKINGHYGGKPEDSFVVANIRRVDLIHLAKKYRQESVIWAKRRQDKQENTFLDFEWIEDGKATEHWDIEVSSADLISKKAFYEAIRSGKIRLPEFGATREDSQDKPYREPHMSAFEDLPKTEHFLNWLSRKGNK